MIANCDEYINNGHLNDEAKAMYIDAMLMNSEKLLPLPIRLHVEDCIICKKEILAVYTALNDSK